MSNIVIYARCEMKENVKAYSSISYVAPQANPFIAQKDGRCNARTHLSWELSPVNPLRSCGYGTEGGAASFIRARKRRKLASARYIRTPIYILWNWEISKNSVALITSDIRSGTVTICLQPAALSTDFGGGRFSCEVWQSLITVILWWLYQKFTEKVA